jgi:hypothetical protein
MPLEVGGPLKMLGLASALNCHRGGSVLDFFQVAAMFNLVPMTT